MVMALYIAAGRKIKTDYQIQNISAGAIFTLKAEMQTETLEFHHIAVYGNQVEGIAGVMPPLLLCEPASQI